ncbi:hypothetical protein HZS_1490 [Henneguya salminicola]|nr:hypothetical protein HZS_1490 [Henneguya salminicola]
MVRTQKTCLKDELEQNIPEPPRILLSDCQSRSLPSVSPLIPSYISLQRNVKRMRQRINLPLTILSDAAHIIIPEQYKISFRSENLQLYDGLENDGERFIIFATPRQLIILSRSSHIYFDSTFKSVPEISYQLFVIHGEYNNVLIPCVFALMEQKNWIMYRRVWEKVQENVKSHAEMPFVILRRHLLIHLCFAIRAHP